MNLLSLIMLLYISRQDGNNEGANFVSQLHKTSLLLILGPRNSYRLISKPPLQQAHAIGDSSTSTNTQSIRQQHISACVLDARSLPTITAPQRCNTMPDLPKVVTEVVMEEAAATALLSSNIMAERAAASAEGEEEGKPPSSRLSYKSILVL